MEIATADRTFVDPSKSFLSSNSFIALPSEIITFLPSDRASERASDFYRDKLFDKVKDGRRSYDQVMLYRHFAWPKLQYDRPTDDSLRGPNFSFSIDRVKHFRFPTTNGNWELHVHTYIKLFLKHFQDI